MPNDDLGVESVDEIPDSLLDLRLGCEIFVVVFSSHSLKMREKYIRFAQLVLLSLYIF